MDALLKSTGLLLVAFFFISFLSISATAEHRDLSEPLNKIKEFQSDLVYHGQRPEIRQLELFGEVIHLNGSHSQAKVQDLSVINGLKQRDIYWDDSQTDALNQQPDVNALDIWVDGGLTDGRDPSNGQSRSYRSGFVGNYLNVYVSNILVSAMNTVEGGNAAATSNIIISPVQTIIYSHPEVSEKLK